MCFHKTIDITETFTLPIALNRTDALDSDIVRICDTVTESLFSVFVTAGKLWHNHINLAPWKANLNPIPLLTT